MTESGRFSKWRVAPATVYGLLVAEAFLFTWGRSAFGPYASPVVLYLCSLAACAGLYQLTRHRPWPAPRPLGGKAGRGGALAAAVAGGLWLCLPQYIDIVRTTLAQDNSDIVMALTVYPQRWLAGEPVYRPLTAELGYFALPTYLPATWFPFVVPEFFRFDYRWMSGVVFALGVGAYLASVYRQRQSARQTFVLALLPFILLFAVVATEPGLVGWTVELLIVGYYLLLVACVLLPSRWGQAALLTICLLSRFSLVFWVPLHLALLYFQGSRRLALGVAGAVLAGILLLYVVPFLSHDWGMFMRVQRSYTDVALGEWNHLNAQGRPLHLYNGVGLGNFFYQYWPGPLLSRLHALQTTHVGLLMGVVVTAALLYWRQLAPRTDYRVFSVLVLKVYLTTFYAFVQVPYAYLASVGLFLSLFLALLVARYSDTASGAAPDDGPLAVKAV